MMETFEIVMTAISVITIIIALAIKIFISVKSIVKEKNYILLTEYAMKAVIYAEKLKGLSGEEKKNAAMDFILKSAENIGVVPPNEQRISDLIEKIVEVSKKVNIESPQN